MRFRLALVLLTALPALAETGGALIDAARTDDHAAVAALLEKGGDANARDEDGATSLAWAANHSNVAMAELLLSKGANPDIANELGIGPLSLAVANASVPL